MGMYSRRAIASVLTVAVLSSTGCATWTAHSTSLGRVDHVKALEAQARRLLGSPVHIRLKGGAALDGIVVGVDQGKLNLRTVGSPSEVGLGEIQSIRAATNGGLSKVAKVVLTGGILALLAVAAIILRPFDPRSQTQSATSEP